MGLVRAAAPAAPPPSPEPADRLIARLDSADAAERRAAARGLARYEQSSPALAARLDREADDAVRDALFASLSEIGGPAVAELLAVLLRGADAGLRGGAIEALKRLDAGAAPVLDALLDDPDSDVRLLAVEVTRAWPRKLAIPRLRRVFEQDPHVNVCAAAVDVATEVGTPDLLASLHALRARFADDPFLQFAVDVACERIHATPQPSA